jgi:hypothetical protein
MLGRILLLLSCLAIGFVGMSALMSGSVSLTIVVLLAIVLLVRYLLPRPTCRRPASAERSEPVDEALQRAREAFLREPTIHQVMPNLGGGQEL